VRKVKGRPHACDQLTAFLTSLIKAIEAGFEPIRQEFVTRLGLGMYAAAIRHDFAGDQARPGLAQVTWRRYCAGRPTSGVPDSG